MDEPIKTADRHSADLTEAADRAGAIVTDQIRAMLEAAESRAREIRDSADQDARQVRQEAVREVVTLFEKIEALERPLGDLVGTLRTELDSLSTEFRRHGGSDVLDTGASTSDRPAVPPEPTAVDAVKAAPPGPEEPAQADEPATVEADADESAAPNVDRPEPADSAEPLEEESEQPVEQRAERIEEPAMDEAHAEAHAGGLANDSTANGASAAAKKRGPLGWLKRRKSAIFITAPGQCAVCQRSYTAGSEEALAASGWHVSGDVGLCPQCQSEGWQLPEGARLPYRRAAS